MPLPIQFPCSSPSSSPDLDYTERTKYRHRLIVRNWLVLIAGIWLQSSTGSSYDFSIYSQTIKGSLGYDQQQLDSVSFAKDIGANVGILSGLLYDAAPTWITLASAAVLGLTGNLMMWLSITAKVATPPLWLVCGYALLAANSQTFSNTAAVVTCVKIFPRSRGTVVGLMKGCLGLSGAMLVQLYYVVYGNRPEDFPLLMAWLVPSMCILVIFVIRPWPVVETRDEREKLNMFSAVLILLSAYLLAVIILQNCISVSRLWRIIILMGIILVLLLPFWVLVKSESGSHSGEVEALFDTTKQNECHDTFEDSSILEEPLSPQENSWIDQANVSTCKNPTSDDLLTEPLHRNDMIPRSHSVHGKAKPKRGENFSLLQAVSSLDFWFLFFASACGMGSGLTTINNMRQLGSSLNYTDTEINTSVSLWSIWNFLGRFGGGYISELHLQYRGTARPLFISVTLAAMAIGHIIIAVAFPGALYVGPILVGICYGAQWSLMPSTASELFGLKSFGAVFNTIAICSPLSSYILSVQITGYLYDVEAAKQSLGSKHFSSESSCSGVHCFRSSFFIMAGVCVGGSIISTVLFLRTKTFYKEQQLMLKRSG